MTLPNQSVYTLSGITDTNSHDLPDTDGDDKSSAQNVWDARGLEKLGVFITNHADQPLTASLDRSPTQDLDLSSEATDTGGVAVSASGDTQMIAAEDAVPHGFYRVVFSFDSIPSSADPSVTVHFQAE